MICSRREFFASSLLPLLTPSRGLDLVAIDRGRVLKAADAYLKERPVTVTASSSPRSAGGKHDYFSEGDYWWPDPNNPDGPYIQRDGMSNPDNFNDHRHALIRLSLQAPALAAAYRITKDRRYAEHAARHLRAWFLAPATLMNPNLQYAQAIKGRYTGRGTGIIDTIHLVEVVRAIPALDLPKSDLAGLKQWFGAYLTWMTTHKYGQDERDAKNNHGTCWVMQVAEFARFTGNQELTSYCTERYKKVLLPDQMAADGSFPLELKRTKPYGYSLFNLDAMATVCQILDLWHFELPERALDGQGGRVYVSLYKGQEELAPPARCDVLRCLARPAAQPAVRGHGARQDRLY